MSDLRVVRSHEISEDDDDYMRISIRSFELDYVREIMAIGTMRIDTGDSQSLRLCYR